MIIKDTHLRQKYFYEFLKEKNPNALYTSKYTKELNLHVKKTPRFENVKLKRSTG